MSNLQRLLQADGLHPSPVAPLVLALVLGLSAGMPSAATAQVVSQAASADFQIPAGPLAPALRQLASTANILLSFTAEQSEGRHTAGLHGRYSVTSALDLLLAGSGLQAVQLNNGAFVLRSGSTAAAPTPTSTAESPATSTLPPVTVTGSIATATTTEGTHSYTTGNMSTATRLNLSIRDTPQAVTVITRARNAHQEKQSSVNLYANGPFELLGRKHEMVLGASYRNIDFDGNSRQGLVLNSSLDLYSFNPAAIANPNIALRDWMDAKITQQSVYATTRLSLTDRLGVFVAALSVTGLVIWARKRRARAAGKR